LSFSASLSGLNAQQQALNTISNNLANINTLAFKSSSVDFSDLVSQAVGGASVNPAQIGLGVTTGSISPNFSQGGISNTGVPTNVAIQGSGFFVVGDVSNRAYTRAGDFTFDANGKLVTSDGKGVQGYTAVDPATGAIITTGQPGDIVVPPGVLRPPTPTTLFGTNTNLDANAAVGDTFTASVPIYDSLGVSHVATMTYTNTAAGTWSYSLTVPPQEVTGAAPGVPKQIATGTLAFGSTGQLTTVNGAAAADVVVTGPTWSNGATAANFTWDLVDGNGVASLTGYQAASATSSITQNGSPAGTIAGININSDGEIIATFGAGQTVAVGQLAMANFNNPQGLVKMGGNAFGESGSSGIANIGAAGTGGRGTLIGSSLEQSNVDVATEFTQMIIAQRGYQANSKSITTADQVLVDTLNIKQ